MPDRTPLKPLIPFFCLLLLTCAAPLDEGSPRDADQTPLFVRHRLKPVWFDEADIRLHLEREYSPRGDP